MGESFSGEAKLPEFVQKYERLLDMLTTAGGLPKEQVRVVLLSPTFHYNLGSPYPDPTHHNDDLRRYCAAIDQIANRRGFTYIDLFRATEIGGRKVRAPQGIINETPQGSLWNTINGIHLNDYGYWSIALTIENLLEFPSRLATVELDASGTHQAAERVVVKVQTTSRTAAKFSIAEPVLRSPPWPQPSPSAIFAGRDIKVTGLEPGQYVLSAGGAAVAWGSAAECAEGLFITAGPSNQQAEQLRKLIVAKNAEYFNYWRPENDTYILGYRKGEQGRNAVELPRFKPLAEAKEKEIAKLRVPQPVTYTLEKK